MNPFGNFKFNQYQQQFAPLPARDIIQSSNQLHQEALRSEASMDKLRQLASQINVLDEDAYIKKAQLDELDRIISEAEKTGAWEHAGKMARESARNFANNRQLASAQKNYAGFQALLKEANEMDVSNFQRAKIQDLRRNYKGTGSADEFGNYKNIGSVNLYKEHDIMGEASEFLKGAKANKDIIPSQREGYWIIDATKEEIKEEDLLRYGMEMVLQNPKYSTQMYDMAMMEATGGDLSKEVTKEELSDAYNKVAASLVSPSSQAYSYRKYGMKRTADGVLQHIAKKDIDAGDGATVTEGAVINQKTMTGVQSLEKLKDVDNRLKTASDKLKANPNSVQLREDVKALEKEKMEIQQVSDNLIAGEVKAINKKLGIEIDEKRFKYLLQQQEIDRAIEKKENEQNPFESKDKGYLEWFGDKKEELEKLRNKRKELVKEKGITPEEEAAIKKWRTEKDLQSNFYSSRDKEVSPVIVSVPDSDQLLKEMNQSNLSFSGIGYVKDGNNLVQSSSQNLRVDPKGGMRITSTKIDGENMVIVNTLNEEGDPAGEMYIPLSKLGGNVPTQISSKLYRSARGMNLENQSGMNPYSQASNEESIIQIATILNPDVAKNRDSIVEAGRMIDARINSGDKSFTEYAVSGNPKSGKGGFVMSTVGPTKDRNLSYTVGLGTDKTYELTSSDDQIGNNFGFINELGKLVYGRENITDDIANAQLAIGVTAFERAVDQFNKIGDGYGVENSYLLGKLRSGDNLNSQEIMHLRRIGIDINSKIDGINLPIVDENDSMERIQEISETYAKTFLEFIDQQARREYERITK